MIKIKINKKTVMVPKYSELTVKQYKDLIPYISESGTMNYIRYISVTTGIDYRDTVNSGVFGLELLNKSLGEFRFMSGDSSLDLSNSFENSEPKLLIRHRKMINDFRSFSPKAVGYRLLLEQFLETTPSYLELYVFMAALVLEKEFDYNDVIQCMNELDNYNAYDIITFGAFFFKKWRLLENKESRFLKLLKKVLLISTKTKNKELELIALINTVN